MLTGLVHWFDDRLGFSTVLLPIIRHPVPKNVNWWYVFGSSTLLVFVGQIITGILLAFTYVPSPEDARDSLLFITNDASLGGYLRGLHYWGASAMVVLVALHLIRVTLTASYKFPRELNWLVGVFLLFLTLGMAFTGQLLRWDQDAFWTAVVGAEQAGRTPFIGSWLAHLIVAGDTVNGQTLTRFYSVHVFLFPATLIALIGLHLYLVVHHGISEPPVAGESVDPETYRSQYKSLLKKNGIPFWPDAAWRDVVAGLTVAGIVIALAIFAGPKIIGSPADPTNVIAYPRPDWFFLWYFAILALIPPSTETWVIIGFPLVVIVILLAVPFIGPGGERSLSRRPWALGLVVFIVVSMAALGWQGNKAPWSPDLQPTPIAGVVTNNMTSDQQTGADLLNTKGCLSCHTVAGTGGKRGPELTNVGSRLTNDEMVWRILNGGHNMPAYGATLTSDELDQIIDFLVALAKEQ